VLGEYSAETVQVVATAMRAGMKVEQLAEMQFAFPTFTEAVSMAAQKACRTIGIGRFPPRLELPRPRRIGGCGHVRRF
jgi:CheY-specific phosphatase CheX